MCSAGMYFRRGVEQKREDRRLEKQAHRSVENRDWFAHAERRALVIHR